MRGSVPCHPQVRMQREQGLRAQHPSPILSSLGLQSTGENWEML